VARGKSQPEAMTLEERDLWRSVCAAAPCAVCTRPGDSGLLCRLCSRDYDRNAHRDSSVWGAIEWAAKRARWFARKESDRAAGILRDGMTRGEPIRPVMRAEKE